MFKFSISNGYGAPALLATPELFRATLTRQDVKERCSQIAALIHGARGSGGTEQSSSKEALDKASLLKRQLPAFCWHAWFDDNKRLQANAHDSGLVMLDLDHIENPKETFGSIFGKARKEGLVAAHLTPSTFGLRLVFRRKEGLDIPESQKLLIMSLALPNVDTCVKDLSRLSFAVPEEYWFFIDYNALFDEPAENNLLIEIPQISCESETCPVSEENTNHQSLTTNPQPVFPDLYDKLPYKDVVQELITVMGGSPIIGERNNFLLRLAGNLRYICNDDPLWLEAVMPDFGEEPAKFRSTIRSALKYEQLRSKPKQLTAAIERVRARLLSAEVVSPDIYDSFSETPPPLPSKLPPLIKHLVRNVPEICRPAVANAVFPSLAAHLYGVSFRLIDGTFKEPTFMCVNIAKQSSGKASVNTPIQYITADIRERDSLNRQREQEWKDEVSKRGANKEKPKRPEDLCVQCLVSDMTNAAFVQRMKDANGRYLYTNLEELELLKQLQTNGTRDVGKIICLCFDNGIYGQERVGTQSVTANVPVRWNWNASTTVRKGQNFFNDRLVDGTLSRINFCTIFKDKTKPFLYKEYDEKYGETLKPFITKLNLASGRYVCPQALDLARKLLDDCLRHSDLADDEVYEQLTYRAVTIAYMKSMVLYIANDCKWDKTIAQFTEWSLYYDLFVKMYYFGDQIRNEEEQENVVVKNRSNSLLPLFPEVFSCEEAEAIRVRAGKSKSGTKNMLYVWVNRKVIEYDALTRTYSKVR